MHFHFLFPLALSLSLFVSGLVVPAHATLSSSDLRDANVASLQELSNSQEDNWLIRAEYSWNFEKEYLPSYRRYLYRWREQTTQLQVGRDIDNSSNLAAGILEGAVNQYSLIFDDYDFQLRRRGAYLQYQKDFSPALQTRLRLRYETFEQNGSSYYQLNGTESLLTGHAQVGWQGHSDWVNFSYVRERDPEPVYDFDSSRAALNIKAQNLSGISWGHAITPQIESVASVYYESYGSERPNQWNTNLQLIWRVLPQLSLALGSGYFSEEKEVVSNLTARWQRTLTERLQLELEYQLEHASEEKSLLHQGQLLFNTRLVNQLYWVLQLIGGKETLEDKDYYFTANSSLSWRF